MKNRLRARARVHALARFFDFFSFKKRPLFSENSGSASKLNPLQTKILSSHLEKHTYLFVKDIVAYVKTNFGVLYTVGGMTGWLCSAGFSYKPQLWVLLPHLQGVCLRLLSFAGSYGAFCPAFLRKMPKFAAQTPLNLRKTTQS